MSRVVLLGLWAVCTVLLVLVVLGSRTGRPFVAPFGRVVTAATSRPLGLVIVWLCWAWAGWHFFAR